MFDNVLLIKLYATSVSSLGWLFHAGEFLDLFCASLVSFSALWQQQVQILRGCTFRAECSCWFSLHGTENLCVNSLENCCAINASSSYSIS